MEIALADKIAFAGAAIIASGIPTCLLGMLTVRYDRIQAFLMRLVTVQAVIGVGTFAVGFGMMIATLLSR